VRTVLELAGVRNVLAKQLGSSNPLNNARAAVNALATLRTFGEVAEERGVPIENLYA
jgi:small subunit ribosomal protein S5